MTTEPLNLETAPAAGKKYCCGYLNQNSTWLLEVSSSVVFRPKYYPYPILAPFSQDYKNATFVVDVTAERTEDGKSLEFLVSLPELSTSIESAVADGFSKLVLDIDCPGTLFRRVLVVQNGRASISVGEVLGDVSVTPLLLVDQDFDFAPDTANEVDGIFSGATPFSSLNKVVLFTPRNFANSS